MLENKTLIAGVGNPYRHDDGIGIEIINILEQKNHPDLDLFDSGTDGFSLLDKVSLYKKAIIVDAVYMGESPGTVKMFNPKEALLKIKSDALSTHGFGLAEVLKLIEELEVKTEVQVIGIEPLDISFGEGLSEIVKNKISAVLDLVEKEL